MHHAAPLRTSRTDRRAVAAGVVASLAVHAALFAFVGFGVSGPSEERKGPARGYVPVDAPSIRLLTLRTDAPEPDLQRAFESATSPMSVSADESGAAGAPAAAPDIGAAEPAAPPVLVTFKQPSPSPLLLAGAVEPVAEPGSASARAAAYTPGGVREAKVAWSGREEERSREARRIGRALSVGTGDGHCPVRPPRDRAGF